MTFLCWVGGKTGQLSKIVPHILNSGRQIYLEPFLGGGAVMLELIKNGYKGQIIVNDLNSELINLWIYIRDKPNDLISEIQTFHEIDKETYINFRHEYNTTEPSIRKSSLFLILNKSAYHGIFRVNRRGQFNVPYGNKHPNPQCWDFDQLRHVSTQIQNVIFETMDYKTFISNHLIEPSNTIIYLDPPYFEQFNNYTNVPFDYEQFNQYLIDLVKTTKVICSNTQEWYDRVKPLWNNHIPVDVFERMSARKRVHKKEAICMNFLL
jgi:DNA adenine methylase